MTASSTYLNGKVEKQSLPEVHPPSGSDAPVLKRLLLPQGELAQFYDGAEPIRYLAFIELKTGSTRGNHYHLVKSEWIYLISGVVGLVLEDLDNGDRDQLTIRAGDLVRIATRVVHALQVVEPGQAVEFSPARFDAQDIHRRIIA